MSEIITDDFIEEIAYALLADNGLHCNISEVKLISEIEDQDTHILNYNLKNTGLDFHARTDVFLEDENLVKANNGSYLSAANVTFDLVVKLTLQVNLSTGKAQFLDGSDVSITAQDIKLDESNENSNLNHLQNLRVKNAIDTFKGKSIDNNELKNEVIYIEFDTEIADALHDLDPTYAAPGESISF